MQENTRGILAKVKQVLAPPVFERDDDKTRTAKMINIILYALLVAGMFAVIAPNPIHLKVIGIVLGVSCIGMWFAIRRGYVRASGFVISFLIMILFSVNLYANGTIRSFAATSLILPILCAGLLVNNQLAVVMTALSVGILFGLFQMENAGLISPPPTRHAGASMADWVGYTMSLSLATVLIVLSGRGTREALRRARSNEQAVAERNRELDEIRATLERRHQRLQDTAKEYGTFMAQVGHGRLGDRLDLNDDAQFMDDPLIVLGRQLNDMVANLQSTILQVRDAANALSAQAAEILASTTQQASGASEQSAAVSQATTTVDEIKTIAQRLVSRSQAVTDSAHRTLEVSRAGQEAVRETIASMAQIKARVDVIEENILSLSERTNQIGEIIDTVNEIAARSNMLALNAAVEAARAGEQGRGFAVVAEEVRDLAERSKAATAQVKTILSDIQRATNATGMATEEGKKGVDAGVQLVAQMGQTIDLLAGVIDTSAQSAMQMSAGGRQQTSGIEQVAVAMQNINQVTVQVQSTASTRQTERSAQEMNDLARSLKEIVAQYRV